MGSEYDLFNFYAVSSSTSAFCEQPKNVEGWHIQILHFILLLLLDSSSMSSSSSAAIPVSSSINNKYFMKAFSVPKRCCLCWPILMTYFESPSLNILCHGWAIPVVKSFLKLLSSIKQLFCYLADFEWRKLILLLIRSILF